MTPSPEVLPIHWRWQLCHVGGPLLQTSSMPPALDKLRPSAPAGAYRDAVDAYTAAIDACTSASWGNSTAPAVQQPQRASLSHAAASPSQHSQQPGSSIVTDRERATLHSNRAAAHERLGAFTSALHDGLAAVELMPHWPKAHLRSCARPALRAQSLTGSGMMATRQRSRSCLQDCDATCTLAVPPVAPPRIAALAVSAITRLLSSF